MKGKILVFSGPSGVGKTTIIQAIVKEFPTIQFSISATTRDKREYEVEDVSYYFITKIEFEQAIKDNRFLEYERFYENYYGTLKDKTDAVIATGKSILLDIEVNGALNVKKIYGDEAILLFIKPESIDVLKARLSSRNTETQEQLAVRIARAEYELSLSHHYDKIFTNIILENVIQEIKDYLQSL